MRKNIFKLIGLVLIAFQVNSCAKLDLNPPSAASSGNWYADATECYMSLNDLYRTYLYELELEYRTDRWTDDWSQRDDIADFATGSVDAKYKYFETVWKNNFKGISRANRVDEALDRLGGAILEAESKVIRAEARFFRAFFYSRLICLYGDLPLFTTSLSIEQARQIGRTDKWTVLKQIYDDFDYAWNNLPEENNATGVYRVSKGAAYALKARVALAMVKFAKDENNTTLEKELYAVAKSSAKACMDLDRYELYDDYGELFRLTKNCSEFVFAIPMSVEFGQDQEIKSWIPRVAGGNGVAQPSWELLASYTDTEGKRIDQSTLFDRTNPFKNRDPRCTETFFTPGEMTVYGVVFDTTPSVTQVEKEDGSSVSNKDNRTVDKYGAYNGCGPKKGARKDWVINGRLSDNPLIIVRYADVLLMYAEACIELNEDLAAARDCMNQVRARAYKCTYTQTSKYPEIAATSQADLRLELRRERRVELAWEGRRYYDLLRWGQFKKAYSHDYYGHTGSVADRTAMETAGKWFWPDVPQFDDENFPNFAPMAKAYPTYVLLYGDRTYFDKVEIWAVPNDEVQLSNGKITQNKGY